MTKWWEISAALEKLPEDVEEDGEGTMHFMVNVVQPQFNLDSEEANVCTSPTSFIFEFQLCCFLQVERFLVKLFLFLSPSSVSSSFFDWICQYAVFLSDLFQH